MNSTRLLLVMIAPLFCQLSWATALSCKSKLIPFGGFSLREKSNVVHFADGASVKLTVQQMRIFKRLALSLEGSVPRSALAALLWTPEKLALNPSWSGERLNRVLNALAAKLNIAEPGFDRVRFDKDFVYIYNGQFPANFPDQPVAPLRIVEQATNTIVYWSNAAPFTITRSQTRLLRTLLANYGNRVSKDQLFHEAFGQLFFDGQALDGDLLVLQDKFREVSPERNLIAIGENYVRLNDLETSTNTRFQPRELPK